MFLKNIAFSLIPLSIAVTLLNITIFGIPSLSAYFFYSILAGLASLSVFTKIVLEKDGQAYFLPNYIKIFFGLAIYIVVHGWITKTFGLVHYYWIINAIFLSSLHFAVSFSNQSISQKQIQINYGLMVFVFRWIAILALFESIVVLFQFFNIIQVKKDLFQCTGTWGNPNVTAMFLSMSLFSVFYIKKNTAGKRVKTVARITLLIILNAIIYLQCRTAYLVTLVFLFSEYGAFVKNYLKRNLKLNLKGFAFAAIILIGIMILLSVFTAKKASTNSRINIWQNSLQLLKQKPFTGFGFGLFEKEYNIYSAGQAMPVNDHINYAYNDFLELGIEGGILTPVLWFLFLFLVGIHFYKFRSPENNMLPVIISFIIIQFTNFGFQAIPAYVIFLVYIGLANQNLKHGSIEDERNIKVIAPNNEKTLFAFFGLLASLLFFIKIVPIAYAFYKNSATNRLEQSRDKQLAYLSLNKKLKTFSLYHENFGDSRSELKEYDLALEQYRMAMENSSDPDLLLKCGYCYQMKGMYDSSQFYYSIVANMQPHRYVPQFFLLRLFKSKKDTTMAINKANEILVMPIKVMSNKVAEIKAFAKEVLDNYQHADSVTSKENK